MLLNARVAVRPANQNPVLDMHTIKNKVFHYYGCTLKGILEHPRGQVDTLALGIAQQGVVQHLFLLTGINCCFIPYLRKEEGHSVIYLVCMMKIICMQPSPTIIIRISIMRVFEMTSWH